MHVTTIEGVVRELDGTLRAARDGEICLAKRCRCVCGYVSAGYERVADAVRDAYLHRMKAG